MAHDIFLSYSRQDEEIAKRFVETCKKHNLTIWYDQMVPAGADWREEIVNNLSAAQAMVIFFSGATNKSEQLKKELAVAAEQKKLVIPILIDNVTPQGHYLYELASKNWIMLAPNAGGRLEELSQKLRVRLGAPVTSDATSETMPTWKEQHNVSPNRGSFYAEFRAAFKPIDLIVVAAATYVALLVMGDGTPWVLAPLIAYSLFVIFRNTKARRRLLPSYFAHLLIAFCAFAAVVIYAVAIGKARGDFWQQLLGFTIFSAILAIAATVLQLLARWVLALGGFRRQVRQSS